MPALGGIGVMFSHKRLQQINALPEEDKHCILYTIDNLLASANTRQAYTGK
ncbi:hypothetical protein [Persicobacter diffluens]|uniref:hypothetical protein n=1 Tax=Persicobacter diffluens TaxID=981 RepID=UPI0030C691A9